MLGVSPATHRLRTLSAEALAASMRALAGNSRFRQRAQQLQQALSRKDGVISTVTDIELELSGGRHFVGCQANPAPAFCICC